jgi:hypothetical protein
MAFLLRSGDFATTLKPQQQVHRSMEKLSGGLGLEMNQDEFRGCAKAHGRTPGAGAASRVDQEAAETFQPIHELAVDARGDPGPREELTTVRVPGKLQGDALLFRDLQLIGSVREQNAGALGVERSLPQNGAESLGMNQSAMVHTDQVQAVEGYLFVVQYTNTGRPDRVEVF